MRKLFSALFALMFILSFSTVSFATDTHFTAGKLTARELSIGKAYLKTLETYNAKYLDAVKYPGVDFETDSLDEGVTAKVLKPVFTKTKDGSLKLDRIDVSGLLVVSSSDKLSLAGITQGMAIKTSKKKVYAFQEVDVKINTIAAFEDLDESIRTALTAYLTDLYGIETANSLINNYAADSEDTLDTTDDEDTSVTPTPTAPR